MGAGPLDRRNFLKAGAAAVVALALAWRFWPWRRGAVPAATPAARGPAGPAAGRAGRCGHPAHRPHPDLAGTGLLGQPAAGPAAAPGGRVRRGRHRPMRTRTVAVLTRELVAGDLPARIGVRTGLPAAGEGFSGFLVGAGGGRLDHRAAAMVQGASGEGGGILCTYEADGRVGFREHTDEARQFAYAPPPRHRPRRPAPPRALEEDVELVLELIPRGRGRFRLRLTVTGGDGATLAAARLDGVDGAALTGGIAPVSSPQGGRRRGPPLVRRPRHRRGQGGQAAERAEGPVLGTLYTLNGAVLKLTAQLFPVGDGDPGRCGCRRGAPAARRTRAWPRSGRGSRPPSGSPAGTAPPPATTGSCGGRQRRGAGVRGHVAADPAGDGELRVGLLDCTIHSYRPLNVGSDAHDRLPGRTRWGCTPGATSTSPTPSWSRSWAARRSCWPPWATSTTSIGPPPASGARTRPGRALPLVPVAVGLPRPDPGGPHGGAGRRPRRLPPQPVGHAGAPAPGGDYRQGGYLHPAAWVNLVQRVQTSHNPDPHDPAPSPRASASTTAPSATAGCRSPWSRTASSRMATRTTATRPAGATT